MGVFEIIMLILSAASAAATIGTNVWTNQQNMALTQQQIDMARENREDTQAFNRYEAELAQRRLEQNYHRLYSPQAQVQQLKRAGLSVGLMYGMGGTGGGTATGQQAASPAAGTGSVIPYINPMTGIGQPSDEMMKALEALKTKSETKKTEEETENLKAIRENLDKQNQEIDARITNLEAKTNTELISQAKIATENRILEIEEKWKDLDEQARIRLLNNEADLMKKQEDETGEKIRGLEIENDNKQALIDLNKQMIQQQMAELLARTLLETQKAETEYAHEELMKAQTDNEKRKWNNLYEERKKIQAETEKALIEAAQGKYKLMNALYENMLRGIDAIVPG